MAFEIKPKIDRFVPHQLSKGWGIIDLTTGELRKKEGQRFRLEKYGCRAWAQTRCDELNQQKDQETCKDT